LLTPEKLLGGRVNSKLSDIIRDYKLTGIPDDSDWRQEKLLRTRSTKSLALMDLEDRGGVVAAEPAAGQGSQIFGPIFVPAHDFRIIYGYAVGD
jgi:hypothetical protein